MSLACPQPMQQSSIFPDISLESADSHSNIHRAITKIYMCATYLLRQSTAFCGNIRRNILKRPDKSCNHGNCPLPCRLQRFDPKSQAFCKALQLPKHPGADIHCISDLRLSMTTGKHVHWCRMCVSDSHGNAGSQTSSLLSMREHYAVVKHMAGFITAL